MKNIKVTIFTPTYNRGYILKKLYKSICNQTCKEFEWIIIDDGSKDDTEELVKTWINSENNFPIIYKKVENGGKHRAINKGIDMASGELFFIVDSDDTLTIDAIEKSIKWEHEISSKKDKYAGIAGLRGYNNQQIMGTTFDGEWIDATSLERDKCNINGDKAEVFYTKVLKNNKFPEFDGENFITESVTWNKIASQGLKIRWYNEIIYLCEYRNDGLTTQGMKIFYSNPKGALYTYKKELTYKEFSTKRKLFAINKYIDVAEHCGLEYSQMSQDLGIPTVTLKIIRFIYKVKE